LIASHAPKRATATITAMKNIARRIINAVFILLLLVYLLVNT